MVALARSGCLILSGVLAAAALACRGQELAPVGISPPRAPEPTAGGTDSGPAEAPPVPSDFRLHMRESGRFLSRGHGERFDAIVWSQPVTTADAAASPLGGALFVEEAIVRDTRGDRSAGLLVMTKEGDSFRFDVIDPDGRVASPERTELCVACHRETESYVFPWRALAETDGG